MISNDGGPWRQIPFRVAGQDELELGRYGGYDGALFMDWDDCDPDCASGTITRVEWTYDRDAKVFTLKDPADLAMMRHDLAKENAGD